MSSLAVALAFKQAILPAWHETGHVVEMVWDPTAVLARRITEGERADVLVMIDGPMDEFAQQGIVVADTVQPLARAGFGLAVAKGRPHPDIATPDRFRAALSEARVAYSRTGASGQYFAALIEKLGIAEAVNRRAVVIPASFTAEKLVTGEADLAVQQISELMSIKGVEVVGPFPGELQVNTDFSVGVFAEARDPELARRFVAHLSTSSAGQAYEAGGLVSRLADI